jgi:single-strand DNA-binding protein
MFGSRGEAIASYMTKGKKIAVDGQLQQDRWEAQDGTKRSKVVIIADNIQFLSSRDSGTQAGSGQSSYKNDSQSGSWNEESSPGAFNRGGSTGNSGTRNNSRPQGPPPNSFEDDIPF